MWEVWNGLIRHQQCFMPPYSWKGQWGKMKGSQLGGVMSRLIMWTVANVASHGLVSEYPWQGCTARLLFGRNINLFIVYMSVVSLSLSPPPPPFPLFPWLLSTLCFCPWLRLGFRACNYWVRFMLLVGRG